MADFTVIWRSAQEAEFRVDYVTAPEGSDKDDVLLAAAQAAVDEYGDDEKEEDIPTPESLLEDYELITIFSGHCKEPFGG